MSSKKSYWIADTEGVKALVEGADELAQWTRVRGWSETTEPVGLEFQWVRHEVHGGRGVMAHDAAVLHEGLGWFPSDPPPPAGLPTDLSPAEAPADAAPSTTATKPAANATSGDKKE
jgi:hypothetical protein